MFTTRMMFPQHFASYESFEGFQSDQPDGERFYDKRNSPASTDSIIEMMALERWTLSETMSDVI